MTELSGVGENHPAWLGAVGSAMSIACRPPECHTVETGGDTFPGYYTMETLKDGKISGMISVNATSGIVWPHWWHGEFVAKSE